MKTGTIKLVVALLSAALAVTGVAVALVEREEKKKSK